MFTKVLIANRGEIAVRIIRACQELGLKTVALYLSSDQGSFHLRLADECVLLPSADSLRDPAFLVKVAQEKKADALHPGYGFLAEESCLSEACQQAGITFIGPSPQVLKATRSKIEALNRAKAVGFRTVDYSPVSYGEADLHQLLQDAAGFGFPLVIKSSRGGRGKGESLVRASERLISAVRTAQAESEAIYGDRQVYFEKAILPTHQISVQILADRYNHHIHLGDRECTLQHESQKLIEEAPAPCLNPQQRAVLHQQALQLARLFQLEGAASIEFFMDEQNEFYFSEIKSRIQVEHPLTEMITRIDLVKTQIRLAAGEPLGITQDEVHFSGSAILCRVNAQDPSSRFIPSPGIVKRVQLSAGPEVRSDSYVFPGCEIPEDYDPLIANITTWGHTRTESLARMSRALNEFEIEGVFTNLPMLSEVLADAIADHCYGEEGQNASPWGSELPEIHLRNLAAAAALIYALRSQSNPMITPERLTTGWHRRSRRLPE